MKARVHIEVERKATELASGPDNPRVDRSWKPRKSDCVNSFEPMNCRIKLAGSVVIVCRRTKPFILRFHGQKRGSDEAAEDLLFSCTELTYPTTNHRPP
jgi:hypothetical protein